MRNFFRKKYFIRVKHKKIVTFLAVLVALITTYVLILPALTLDNETANSQAGIEVEQSSQQSQSPPSLASPQDNNLGSSIVGSQPNSVEQGNTQTDTSEPDLITQATTLTASNQDYTITADVDEKAQLPKDTTLIVKEVKSDDSAYQGNYQKAQETLIGKNIESVLFMIFL